VNVGFKLLVVHARGETMLRCAQAVDAWQARKSPRFRYVRIETRYTLFIFPTHVISRMFFCNV